jgi:hypothetical protein
MLLLLLTTHFAMLTKPAVQESKPVPPLDFSLAIDLLSVTTSA